MELQERINPVYREMYQRMLGITELPDFLLKEYFAMKKLVDKVDGVMSPFDLALIATKCGFNSDTMKFDATTREIAYSEDDIKKINADTITTTGTPVQPPVDFTPVDVPPEEIIPGAEAARPTLDLKTVPGEPYPEAVTLYLVGQNVEIKQNDDILSGKVVGVPSGKKKTYTVMTEDDDTYEVDESDISEE